MKAILIFKLKSFLNFQLDKYMKVLEEMIMHFLNICFANNLEKNYNIIILTKH